MAMSQNVIEHLQSHRSIRQFTDRPIEPELLRSLIQARQSGVTSSNLQGVSVIRVRNTETKAVMVKLQAGRHMHLCRRFIG